MLDRKVADTQRTVLRRIVNTGLVDGYHCRIPFHVYAGASDDIVRAASAQAAFPGASTIAGNHFTILDPAAPGNRTAETVKRHILADFTAPFVVPAQEDTGQPSGQPLPPGGSMEKAPLVGRPTKVLMGDTDRQIADEEFGLIDSEFLDQGRSPGGSGMDLPTASAAPSADEQEMPQVGGQNDALGAGDDGLKESSTNIRRTWVVIGILVAVSVVIITLIQTSVIDWSNSPAHNSSSSNPYMNPAVPASPNNWLYNQWTGELLLSGDSSGGAGLSSVPPNVNSNSGDEDVTFVEGALMGTGPIASWNGKGLLTASTCALLVSTEGVRKITPEPGRAICVKTTQGDVAILVIKKNYVDGTGAATSTLVQATVWSS